MQRISAQKPHFFTLYEIRRLFKPLTQIKTTRGRKMKKYRSIFSEIAEGD